MRDYSRRSLCRFRLCMGLLFPAHISVLLALCFILNVRATTSKLASQLQNGGVPAQSQKSNSLPDEQQTKVQLADGTSIRLKFARKVVSSQVIAGEKIPLEVVEPVLVGKLLAVPQHSVEEAILTMVQAGRSMGRGGNLRFKVESIRLADGELVPVRSSKDAKDAGRQMAVNAGAAQPRIMYWLGTTFIFDSKGRSASIPAGTEITTYVAGDFPLDALKFQSIDATAQERDKSQ